MGEQPIEPPPVVEPTTDPQELGAVGVTLDQEGRLAEDVVCRGCGYNLRGLMLDSHCPECDTAIEYTLHRFLLRFSDPAWLTRIRFGLTLLIVAILAGIVLGAAWLAVFMFALDMIEPSPVMVGTIVILPTVGLTIMSVVGYVYVTTAEPGSISNGTLWSARHLARIGLISSAVIGLVAVIIDQDTYTPFEMASSENGWIHGVMWGLSLLSTLAGFIGLFALFIYGRSLALRFPADRLAKITRLVMWGYMIPSMAASLGSIAFSAWLDANTFNTSPDFFFTVMMVFQVVYGVPFLVFGIWGIVLLFIFRHRLKRVLALTAR